MPTLSVLLFLILKVRKRSFVSTIVSVLILLPLVRTVGCILGKGGAVIKSIREDSGSSLKMSDQPLPGSTDKTLTIKGDNTQVCVYLTFIVGYY